MFDPGGIVDNKYLLLSQLGEGGMGTVYQVRHLGLKKEMALKTFRSVNLEPVAWQRFQREAQAIAKLTHPNVVQVFDYGLCEGNVPYYTMEILPGKSLAALLATRGRLSVTEGLRIFTAVAAGLAHAHRHGVVHRDIKPANIIMADSAIKLVDFGLAKVADAGNQYLTDIGIVCGSPLYMSPEQASSEGADWRSDIYSFGCALFETLTGFPPFMGSCALDTINMHQRKPAPRLSDVAPELFFSPALETFMARLLAKDPAARPQSLDEILIQLNALSKEALRQPQFTSSTNLVKKAREWSSACIENSVETLPLVRLRASLGPSIFAVLALLAFAVTALLATRINAHSPATVNVRPRPDSAMVSEMVHPLLTTKRFFSTFNANGDRRFDIESGHNLGFLSWGGRKAVPAEGIIIVPHDSFVTLEVGEGLKKNANMLAHFHPDEFYSVTCTGFVRWDDKILDAITRYLTRLSELTLTACNIGPDGIAQMDRLESLLRLNLAETNLNGARVSKLKHLRQLQYLDISVISKPFPTLVALEGNSALEYLLVRDCSLQEEDLSAIGKINNLRELNLDENLLTPRMLQSLTGLKRLDTLSITGSALEPDTISVLARFKSLRTLRINLRGWSERDRQRLCKALPPECRLIDALYSRGMKSYLELKSLTE